MGGSPLLPRRWLAMVAGVAAFASLLVAPSAATSSPGVTDDRAAVPDPLVEGPLPGAPPGDPGSPVLEDTYPWFATWLDVESAGFVEEEFTLSGRADAYSPTGELLATDVAYETRIIVRRPANPRRFNGTVLAEWQNVTAGYDLDALWGVYRHVLREGYAWVGISAQRVGVDHLTSWSPTRYGDLDVTGDGQFLEDELSYDIFSQAAKAIRSPQGVRPLGRLGVDNVLAIGASQSATRMTIYYDAVLPQIESVFDGYAFVVGPAPSREGDEPVFQIMSETDVRSPDRPADTDRFRRWEVAGTAHSGWNGQEYRQPLQIRDLGAPSEFECQEPPFSRVPLDHVLGASFDHLVRWVERAVPPPTAEPLAFNPDGTKARDALGLARGGIRLSQVEAPIALNTGDNGGESFCFLFGTHVPFDDETLAELYPSHGRYVRSVVGADLRNVRDGFITHADLRENLAAAVESDVGR